MAQSLADLMDFVRTNLGGGDNTAASVDVELTDKEITNTYTNAIDLVNQHRPQRARVMINYAAGTRTYQVNAPGILGIIDVQAVQNRCENPCDVFAAPGAGWAGGIGNYGDTYGDIVQQRSYDLDTRRVTGRDFDWSSQKNADGSVTLFVQADAGSIVQCEYTWAITADDSPTTGVAVMAFTDYNVLQDYMLARCKKILGTKRRKYAGGINMPDGNTEQLDGDTLYNEGVQEENDVVADLKSRRRPLPPALG